MLQGQLVVKILLIHIATRYYKYLVAFLMFKNIRSGQAADHYKKARCDEPMQKIIGRYIEVA